MEMYPNGSTDRRARGQDRRPAARAGCGRGQPRGAQAYVGRYQTAGPGAEIALGADGVLTVQLAGQQAIPMRAVSATEFIIQGVNARLVFHPENGQVNRFVVHQNGRELEARRVAP